MIGVEQDRARQDIPDGFHTGAIVGIEICERKGFKYLDLTLTVADVADSNGRLAEVKAGYPLYESGNISPSSMAGQMFARFGVGVVVGSGIDEQKLQGRLVQFVTVRRSKNLGKAYVEVDRESLKPYQLPPQPQAMARMAAQ
jgi:hypothetical protein